jgi:hypothetical protein
VAAIPPIISHITNPTHHIHFTVTSHRHPRPHRPTLCVRARAELIHSHGPLEPGLLTYVASLRLAYGANADPEQAAQVSGERYNSSSVSSPPPTSSSTSSTLFVGDFGSTRATGLTASFHRCFPCRVLSVLFVCPNPVLASKPLSQTPPIGSIDETYDSWGAVREATESGSLEGHDSAGNGRTDGDMAEQCVVFHSLCSSAPERMQSGWRDGADAAAPPSVCIRFSRGHPAVPSYTVPHTGLPPEPPPILDSDFHLILCSRHPLDPNLRFARARDMAELGRLVRP